MTERLHLSSKHRVIIETLLREHLPGVEVWVYGSRVNGRSHDGSDLDLVLRGPGLNEIPVGQLGNFEEAVRDSTIPFLVEARDWARLPERFHREIERGYVVLVEKEKPDLSDDGWVSLRLGDVCTKIGSGATPRGGKEVYLPNGPCSLIRSQNVYNNRFSHDGLAFITEQQATELNNVEVFPGDVLLNITGDSVARACQVAPDVLPARANQHVAIIRPDTSKLSARFLHYFLVCPETQAMLLSWAGSGGTRNALTKGIIESLDVYAPANVAEQRAIAHILGTLDDKIELNRRMNETLEAMARALFKSWFVDFDPVRAKAALRNHAALEGKPANQRGSDWSVERARAYLDRMDPEIAVLFPDRLVDSELGEIPAGWEVGKLGNVAENPRRGVQPNDIDLGTSYIALEHMPKRCIALSEWSTATSVGSNKYAFRRGEFLFGKLRPYFHKVGIAPVGGVCSTDIVVIAPNANLWSPFVLLCISSDEFVAYTDQASTGTKMPRTSWHTMEQFEICLPPKSITTLFQEIAQPMLDRIVANCHESRILAALRDTLLPKLVSGELRARKLEATKP